MNDKHGLSVCKASCVETKINLYEHSLCLRQQEIWIQQSTMYNLCALQHMTKSLFLKPGWAPMKILVRCNDLYSECGSLHHRVWHMERGSDKPDTHSWKQLLGGQREFSSYRYKQVFNRKLSASFSEYIRLCCLPKDP